MTPKEKSEELIKKFIEPTKVPNIKHIWVEDTDAAIQCALIAVDEILNYIGEEDTIYPSPQFYYWQEVKEQINKL